MRVLCVFGEHNYGDPKRGQSYEYRNFLPAFRRLGHETLFFECWNRSLYRDFRLMNRALLETVQQHRPDVIFALLMNYEIWTETWDILRRAGIAATANWAADDSWKYRQFSRLVAPHFHAFATTYADIYQRYQADGMSHVCLTQWAANPEALQPPLPAKECQYPVCFVGTAHGKRRAWVHRLRQRGIDIACFGHGWSRGPVAAEEIPRIIRSSVISLNFANLPGPWVRGFGLSKNQIKARTFEVPGSGGFLLTESAVGLERYYTPGREIAVFRSLGDLERKIRYYLFHLEERDAIARSGFERTRTEHTYDQRFAQVLDFAQSQKDRYFAQLGLRPSGCIDWEAFAAAAERHTINPTLSLLKRALVPACSVIWGRRRASRAARRLVFEMSWRLVGAHTYSAAGLPGRMFYAE
jgi:spore maturation protein CgeB